MLKNVINKVLRTKPHILESKYEDPFQAMILFLEYNTSASHMHSVLQKFKKHMPFREKDFSTTQGTIWPKSYISPEVSIRSICENHDALSALIDVVPETIAWYLESDQSVPIKDFIAKQFRECGLISESIVVFSKNPIPVGFVVVISGEMKELKKLHLACTLGK